jgi:murein DD-endopeptidase MepM/ murein hydrolase activator NlpD
VSVGQVIGHVGYTGSSREPHLHLHIDDQPSFLGGDPVPYGFSSFETSGPVEILSKPDSQTVAFGPIGPQQPSQDDYPAENALVTFSDEGWSEISDSR